jgi:hypothetical protein
MAEPFIGQAVNMNWQVVKYRHPTLFVRQDGKIYEFKVNEDGTIEYDGSLSAQLRDASACLPRYRRWFGHWISE